MHTPPFAKPLFPPDQHAPYKDNFAAGKYRMASYILIPRASVSFGLVVGERNNFFSRTF